MDKNWPEEITINGVYYRHECQVFRQNSPWAKKFTCQCGRVWRKVGKGSWEGHRDDSHPR